MTLTMVLVVAAAVLFSVFCILCLHTLYRGKKESKEFTKRVEKAEEEIASLKKELEEIRGSAERFLEEKRLEREYGESIKLEGLKKSAPKKAKPAQQPKAPAAPAQTQQTKPVPQTKAPAPKMPEVIEIEEVDDEIDLEDIFGPDKEEPVEKTPPQPGRMGHDVGRSGKKYTVSELDMLIRE